MALRYDEVALEEFKSIYGEELVSSYIETGRKILEPRLKENEDVYVIFEPDNAGKQPPRLYASYVQPRMDDGRKTAARIFLKG